VSLKYISAITLLIKNRIQCNNNVILGKSQIISFQMPVVQKHKKTASIHHTCCPNMFIWHWHKTLLASSRALWCDLQNSINKYSK